MAKKTYPMAWLPNEHGLRVNVLFNDEWHPMVVEKEPGQMGCHLLLDANTKRHITDTLDCIWGDLKGWQYA